AKEVVVGPDPSDRSSRACARCGSPIAPRARFCGHCGLTVSATHWPPRLPDRPPDDRRASVGADAGSDLVGDFSAGARVLGQYPVMVVPPLIAVAVVFVGPV